MALLYIPDNYKMYHFDKKLEVKYALQPGDSGIVCVTDAPDGQIKSETESIEELDIERANPVTGPIGVDGAEPGDTLIVDIGEIEPGSTGIMGMTPGDPLLGKYIGKPVTRLLNVNNGKIQLDSLHAYRAKPMVGVVGVTPEYRIKTNLAGPHGGNMDNRFVTTGSRVYIPVFVKDAMLGIGDLHAAMGDGEVTGCGVEITGRIKIKVGLVRKWSIGFPVIEDYEKYMIQGEGWPVENAIRSACDRALKFLTYSGDMSIENACLFLGAFAHVGICQAAFLSLLQMATVRISIPKDTGIKHPAGNIPNGPRNLL